MCPACVASAAMMIGSVLSGGGLMALAVKVLGNKGDSKKSFRKENQKEETWAK
jgi:hypothetical protein